MLAKLAESEPNDIFLLRLRIRLRGVLYEAVEWYQAPVLQLQLGNIRKALGSVVSRKSKLSKPLRKPKATG